MKDCRPQEEKLLFNKQADVDLRDTQHGMHSISQINQCFD